MHVTKRIDLNLLEAELASAGVVVPGLGMSGPEGDAELFTYDETGDIAELPPEAVPVVDAHDASKPQKSAAFEVAEDAERLAIIAARAAEDPAFAALAELTLGKQGVQT